MQNWWIGPNILSDERRITDSWLQSVRAIGNRPHLEIWHSRKNLSIGSRHLFLPSFSLSLIPFLIYSSQFRSSTWSHAFAGYILRDWTESWETRDLNPDWIGQVAGSNEREIISYDYYYCAMLVRYEWFSFKRNKECLLGLRGLGRFVVDAKRWLNGEATSLYWPKMY